MDVVRGHQGHAGQAHVAFPRVAEFHADPAGEVQVRDGAGVVLLRGHHLEGLLEQDVAGVRLFADDQLEGLADLLRVERLVTGQGPGQFGIGLPDAGQQVEGVALAGLEIDAFLDDAGPLFVGLGHLQGAEPFVRLRPDDARQGHQLRVRHLPVALFVAAVPEGGVGIVHLLREHPPLDRRLQVPEVDDGLRQLEAAVVDHLGPHPADLAAEAGLHEIAEDVGAGPVFGQAGGLDGPADLVGGAGCGQGRQERREGGEEEDSFHGWMDGLVSWWISGRRRSRPARRAGGRGCRTRRRRRARACR